MADVQTQTPQIEAHALARHVRMSPQKARLVIDLIRGQKVQDALQTLRYTPKRAAKHIEKVLRSAVANAEKKAEDAGSPLDVDQLFVSKAFVNEGPRWKRLRPAPMGRRSEEHTSELQSQSNLVCRLLLEKKKKTIIPFIHQQKKKKIEKNNK